MNNLPNNFNNDPTPNLFNLNNDLTSNRLPHEQEEMRNFSLAEIEAAKKRARKMFLILLIIGLTLGAVVSVGVIKVLTSLGLTQKNPPTLTR